MSEGWIDLQSFWQWWCSWWTNLVPHGMNDNWWSCSFHSMSCEQIHSSKWVRDELIFNASDNDVAPESPILLIMEWMRIDNHAHGMKYHKHSPRSKWVRDELTFNPSDNDVAPDEPISLLMELMRIDNHVHAMKYHKHNLRSKWVRDELIFNASDNDDAPDSPIMLLMKWMMIIIMFR